MTIKFTLAATSYVGMFSNRADAIEFENQVLSVGDEFLPEFAIAVRDGEEPSAEYWQWLKDQFLSSGGHDLVQATERGYLRANTPEPHQ